MRKRRMLDSETRRIVMSAWCRVWWGDDGWLQVDSRMVTVGGVAVVGVIFGTVEGEEMRLALILCLAVPLVVCAAVCDVCEWCIRRVRR